MNSFTNCGKIVAFLGTKTGAKVLKENGGRMTLGTRATRRVGILTAAFIILSFSIPVPARAIQCVPYARQFSGIALYGAAWTWWRSASGQYERGNRPEVGAALVFKKSKGMPLGHVAVVTEVVNNRLIKVSHANWVHRRGKTGKVEYDAAIFDESPNNDWSVVRVWYSPIDDFGFKVYSIYGFIYPG